MVVVGDLDLLLRIRSHEGLTLKTSGFSIPVRWSIYSWLEHRTGIVRSWAQTPLKA